MAVLARYEIIMYLEAQIKKQIVDLYIYNKFKKFINVILTVRPHCQAFDNVVHLTVEIKNLL